MTPAIVNYLFDNLRPVGLDPQLPAAGGGSSDPAYSMAGRKSNDRGSTILLTLHVTPKYWIHSKTLNHNYFLLGGFEVLILTISE